MELANLFKEQKVVKAASFDRNVAETPASMAKKLLSLQSELGNLAMKCGCCDMSDAEEALPAHGLLENYINCFHLIIDIGIKKDYTGISVESKLPEYDLTQQFLNLFIDINDLVVFSYRDHYITLVEDYLGLGLKLGFTEEEIQTASNYKSIFNI